MAEQYRRRVGAVRPSHLMYTSGVGALVDLPNFSVVVSGLDDWTYTNVGYQPIVEPRLLAAVRRMLAPTVREIRPAPWLPGQDNDPDGDASRVGVPTRPFPNYLRCTACDELATVDSKVFGFENAKARRPQDARFFHLNCARKKRGRPLAVAARFVLACTAGHLDDFPYSHFVHQGAACPKATHPRLRMRDRGGNIGVNVEIVCVSCEAHRNIRQAMGRRGEANLPRCRGRDVHLRTYEPAGCGSRQMPKVLIVGASNQWFPQTLSALAVPRTGAAELETLVEQHWETLAETPGKDMLPFLRTVVPVLKQHFVRWSDDQLWEAIERQRARGAHGQDESDGYPDLRTPEWEIFSGRDVPDATADFTMRRDPAGVPAELAGCFSDVVQVERLREARAMVGFTRLDAPDPDDPDLVTRAPLSRGDATWVPGSEVRGEGLFLRVPSELLNDWADRVRDSAAMRRHRAAYAQFRKNRYSDRINASFDEMKHWPGERYVALHTLSHLLIRTIAVECGYSSASLSEIIYAGGDDDPRGGILIYTAVPDAEGTLGGLVSRGEPGELVRITRRALRDARHCSSDPLCAERLPHPPADFLHGAACHVCLFVSETTCERGNRFLDRRFVVPIAGDEDLALFRDLP